METQILDQYTQAVELFEQKDFPSAQKILLSIVDNNQLDFDAFQLLGTIHLNLGEMDEAKKCFEKVISIYEPHPFAHYNLGLCYQSLNNKDFARIHFEKALIYAGNNYRKMGNEVEAEKCFDKIPGDNNSKAITLTNLGVIRMTLGFVEEALEYFNIALKYSDEYPEIHYNKSHALLITGNFEEGWKEYEWRKKRKEFHPRVMTKPELKTGIDVGGKKILVYDEQGLGDSIQFIRYVPMLVKSGAKVILECNKKLFGIFEDTLEEVKIIERNLEKEPIIEYDYQIPLLSLPSYFNTILETIPSNVPYIFAKPEYSNKWRNIIKNGNGLKAGIVWAGNPNHTNDKNRSIKTNALSPLFSIEGVKFYSLQKGEASDEIKEMKYPIISFNNFDEIPFLDSAAIIENLDLVITVDTSVAHLAAAMGKPTWLLLTFIPDWRWQLKRNDSPWYPSMKIFRQKEEGNWTTVFDEVVGELFSLVNSRNYQVGNMKYGVVNPVVEFVEATGSFKYPSVTKRIADFDFEVKDQKLYLGLSGTGDFGWGIVNKYLKQEVSNKIEVYSLEEKGLPSQDELKEAKVFQLLRDLDLNPLFEVRGKENFGYTVFENELNERSVVNAARYDKVIAASTWGRNKLQNAGIKNAECIIQGIDTNLFFPGDQKQNDNLFVIFSGGKFELRKGQDLVLRAISILQKKYKDIILITAWYNLWLESARLMLLSKHIKYEEQGSTWEEFMNHIYLINEVDPKRVFTMPLMPNQKLRELYLKSDVGLFPNRCEGGTNLVMMEYMACGKPVIASYNTGHKDVLTGKNSIMLKEMKEYKLLDQEQNLVADWEEPDLDEIISKIEYAYHHRDEIKMIGSEAAESMKNFSWANTADNLLKIVGL